MLAFLASRKVMRHVLRNVSASPAAARHAEWIDSTVRGLAGVARPEGKVGVCCAGLGAHKTQCIIAQIAR